MDTRLIEGLGLNVSSVLFWCYIISDTLKLFIDAIYHKWHTINNSKLFYHCTNRHTKFCSSLHFINQRLNYFKLEFLQKKHW